MLRTFVETFTDTRDSNFCAILNLENIVKIEAKKNKFINGFLKKKKNVIIMN